MKKIAIISLFLSGLLSCKNDRCIDIEGPRVSKSLGLDSVNTLSLAMVATVNLNVDSNNQLIAEKIAQDQMQKQILLEQDSNELFISLNQCYKEHLPVSLNLNLLSLKKINVLSAGDVISNGLINSDSLTLFNNGLGSIDVAVLSKYINGTIKSSGDIKLTGATDKIDVTAIGSGRVNAYNLQAKDVTVNTFSIGVVEVYAREKLRVNFKKSGGTVKYRGNPEGLIVTGVGTLVNDNL